jgi:hypothetical protein
LTAKIMNGVYLRISKTMVMGYLRFCPEFALIDLGKWRNKPVSITEHFTNKSKCKALLGTIYCLYPP